MINIHLCCSFALSLPHTQTLLIAFFFLATAAFFQMKKKKLTKLSVHQIFHEHHAEYNISQNLKHDR